MNDPARSDAQAQAVQATRPRTRLGEHLLRIPERIVASGEPLLSWTEIEHEIGERRGGVQQHS